MKPESKSLTTYIILGIVAGYASFMSQSNYASLVIALILYFAGSAIIRKIIKEKRKAKWLLGNGGAIYFFVWFIVWILLYNLAL